MLSFLPFNFGKFCDNYFITFWSQASGLQSWYGFMAKYSEETLSLFLFHKLFICLKRSSAYRIKAPLEHSLSIMQRTHTHTHTHLTWLWFISGKVKRFSAPKPQSSCQIPLIWNTCGRPTIALISIAAEKNTALFFPTPLTQHLYLHYSNPDNISICGSPCQPCDNLVIKFTLFCIIIKTGWI